MIPNRILSWTSPQDAVSKRPKADGRIVVRVGSIVEMDIQQGNVIPYRRRNSSD
jgi:hypothetical protein